MVLPGAPLRCMPSEHTQGVCRSGAHSSRVAALTNQQPLLGNGCSRVVSRAESVGTTRGWDSLASARPRADPQSSSILLGMSAGMLARKRVESSIQTRPRMGPCQQRRGPLNVLGRHLDAWSSGPSSRVRGGPGWGVRLHCVLFGPSDPRLGAISIEGHRPTRARVIRCRRLHWSCNRHSRCGGQEAGRDASLKDAQLAAR
jgi:hypothetical protein